MAKDLIECDNVFSQGRVGTGPIDRVGFDGFAIAWIGQSARGTWN
ncbi:hypothetical protein O209_14440 [Lactiplantibacillus plantarum WHE 92]|nr:hypothetical protein O209_14440 [Lactiplantibacillus plantarum WHE 92]